MELEGVLVSMLKTRNDQKSLLRRYLLGSTLEDERETVELALLADEQLYEELLATEEELIDEYVCGELEGPEESSFLRYLRALPDHEKRVAFARALKAHATGSRGDEIFESGSQASGHNMVLSFRFRTPPSWAAAAVVLMTLGGIWSLIMISERQNEEERGEQPTIRVAARNPSRSFLLTAGTLRSGGTTPVLRIPEDAAPVEFRLEVGFVDHQTYRAVVYDSEAEELVSLSELKALVQKDEILIAFRLPSQTLTRGDYYVSLIGVTESGAAESVGRYDFRVVRE